MLDYMIHNMSKCKLNITFNPDEAGLLDLIVSVKDECNGCIVDMFWGNKSVEFVRHHYELEDIKCDLIYTIEFDTEQERDYFAYVLNKRIDIIKKLEILYNNTEVNNGSNNK